MTTALMRAPSRTLAACELTHLERAPIDFDVACAEHAAYARALTELGVRVLLLPALDDLPDAVFVEDAALALEHVAVITRPGAPSRRPECDALAEVLGEVVPLARLTAPATLDGGDVLRIGDVLYVGLSSRTNHAGLKALAHLVLEHGLRVKAVSVRGALHLKSACSYLGNDTLLVHPARVPLERFPPFTVIEVDPREPAAANALCVGDTVIMASEFPHTIARVQAHGFRVRATPISQFTRAEAGVTCLSLLAGWSFPD